MDNQHKKIKGYRDLSQEEIDLMNEIKEKGEELRSLVKKICSVVLKVPQGMVATFDTCWGEPEYTDVTLAADKPEYWLNYADSYFRGGIMALVRAVAQPQSY